MWFSSSSLLGKKEVVVGSWGVEDGRRASSAMDASRSEGGKIGDVRAAWKIEGMALGLERVDVSCAVKV